MPGLKTIYSKDGSPLTDIRASVTRSWLLKDIGEAIFNIALDDVKCRREYLEYGNILFVRHDTLPDWIGIIDTPRGWRNGFVEVHAYEPAMLLKYRYPPIDYKFTGTPGEKFDMLIDAANTQYNTLIQSETVSTLGDSTEETFSHSVYDHITDLCDRYNLEWRTFPIIAENGSLTIGMDFVPRVGIDTDAELIRGKNVLAGDTHFEESGELINHIEALTDAINTQAESTIYGVDAAYGFRSLRTTFSGVGIDVMPSIAQNYIAKSKDPTISIPMTIIDRAGLYSKIAIGNTLKYSYGKIGFSDGGFGVSRKVRVAGYRFDESIGTCELFTENI